MTTILFDLDGTLIDSTEVILESFEVSFREKIQPIIQSYKKHYRTISREKTTLLPYAREALEEAKEFAILGIVTTKTLLKQLNLSKA